MMNQAVLNMLDELGVEPENVFWMTSAVKIKDQSPGNCPGFFCPIPLSI